MSALKKVFSDRVLGILFIMAMVFAVWLTNAIFTQKFTPFDRVSLKTDTIGLQLPSKADVKVRGVIVGQVLEMNPGSNADQAELVLGINPDKIGSIPANVSAAILPKTLFGEKYVALNIPQQAEDTPLADGDSIKRTKLPIEVEKVLNDLYPLLRTVQPAELNYTLNALATALEGRGQRLGENLVILNGYLEKLNPQVPALVEDLRLLANASDTYADVVPALATTLRNTVKTTGTLEGREAKLRTFLRDTTGFSDVTRGFLKTNGDNIIRLGKLSEPQLALLARYSPTSPCLLKGIVNQAPLLASTFRGFIFHIELKTLKQQPRGYTPGDRQVYGATNGPNCAQLPSPPVPFTSVPNFNDGVNGLGRGDGQRTSPSTTGRTASSAPTAPTLSSGISATAQQKSLFNALTGPVLGVPVDRVPDLATMLFAPMAAGTEVSVR